MSPLQTSLRRAALVLASTTVLLGAGADCGATGANSLDGSISESHDLAFDTVELRRYESGAIQLDYLHELESGDVEVTAKIVFDAPEGGIVTGEEIDLVAHNGVAQRAHSDGQSFPAIESGALTFTSGGEELGAAAGDFAITFESGKTLNGDFEAELTEASF